MKLVSQEMVNEMLERGKDPEVRKGFKDLNIALFLVATDCPGNEDRQAKLVIKDGELIDTEVIIKPAPSDLRTAPFDESQFDARVVCRFDKLIDIIQEKMSLIAALGYVKIDGNMAKLMKQVGGFVELL
ncbi:MAG: hypothetical protein WC333_04275, partial [Dehalococcoidia bacterium]